MAQGTVGALRVILGVDSAAFEKGMNEASKRLKRFQRNTERFGRSVSRFGQNMTLAVTGAATVLGGLSVSAMNAFGELADLSHLAGVGAKEFKVLSLAAREFGIGQEKLADILKDVNDKFGDYFETGGGPLADFFENIAPKVGLTAESFKNLSGPDALQLYIKALEDAGVSQQQMTFYMEALASDATALVPVFQNGGAAIDDMRKRADALGLSIDETMVKKAKEARDEMRLVGDVLKTNLQAALIDLVPVFADLARAAIPVIKRIVEGIKNLADRFKNMSPEAQKFVTVLTAIAVAAGPAIAAVGSLIAGVAAMAGPLGIVIALLIGAGGLVYAMHKSNEAHYQNVKANSDLGRAMEKSQKQRKEGIALTAADARASIQKAIATRKELAAEIDLQRQRAKQARDEARTTAAFTTVGGRARNEGAKRREQIAERMLAEAEAEYAANTEAMSHNLRVLEELNDARDVSVTITDDTTQSTKTATQANDDFADALSEVSDELNRRNQAHRDAVEGYELEIGNTLLLAAAMKKGAREYEIVNTQIQIMQSGFRGTATEAREMAEELVAAREAMDEAKDGSNALTEAQKRLQDALKETSDKSQEAGEKSKSAFEEAADGFTGFLNALQSKDPVRIIEAIIKAIIRLKQAQNSQGQEGGGLSSLLSAGASVFGGFRAKGGPVTAGKAYVGGEQRPEMFLPGRNGSIVPNGGMGMAQVMIVPTPYFDAKVQGEAAKVSRPIATQESQYAIASQRKTAAFRQSKRLE